MVRSMACAISVLVASSWAAIGEILPAREVVILRDGRSIVGSWVSPRPGRPVIVLLHGLGSNRGEWDGFVRLLASRGWGSFAYDARGHGESARGGESYQTLGPAGPGSAWDRMTGDLIEISAVLSRRHGIKDNDRALCGASLGANVVLSATAGGLKARAIVLLSPGMEYAGLQTEPAASRLSGTDVLMSAAPVDSYAFFSVQRLAGILRASNRVSILQAPGGHGVQMFSSGLDLQTADWLDGLWSRK